MKQHLHHVDRQSEAAMMKQQMMMWMSAGGW
jgi:hypothetical protein